MILKGNMEILGSKGHHKVNIKGKIHLQEHKLDKETITMSFTEVMVGNNNKVIKTDRGSNSITNDMILMQEMPARQKDKLENSFKILKDNKENNMKR